MVVCSKFNHLNYSVPHYGKMITRIHSETYHKNQCIHTSMELIYDIEYLLISHAYNNLVTLTQQN